VTATTGAQPAASPPGARRDSSAFAAAAAERSAAAVASRSVPNPEAPVRTRALSKRFRTQLAVDAVDLSVPAGAVYGFLGPNGSGKTTTIRMLLGLIRPTSGQISLLGAGTTDIPRALRRVGALVEGPAFHPYLSGRANLRRLDAADRYADSRTARQRIDAALDRVGLLAAAGKRYRAYSLGMRQRLAIASALLMPRDLLVLDEPTNGLDPQGTREVRHLIEELADDGVTVLVSSHLLSEVDQMCTHVGVMYNGRLVSEGPIADLRAGTVRRVRVDTEQTADAIRVLSEAGLDDVRIDPAVDGAVSALLGDRAPETLVPALVAADVGVRGFAVVSPSLEDIFVDLTGEGFDVSG
jgi:ABC-type multidrug transport system ATPase subunit